MSFGYLAKPGYYSTPAALAEVDRMAELGVAWVALMASVMRDTFHSTRPYQDFEFTPDDHEQGAIISRFHERGLRVMLKPMVECHDSAWRGRIAFPEGDQQIQGRVTPYWDTWLESLRQSVVHYGRLAARTGCEAYCIGCELYGAEQANNNARWERMASATPGPLPSSCGSGTFSRASSCSFRCPTSPSDTDWNSPRSDAVSASPPSAMRRCASAFRKSARPARTHGVRPRRGAGAERPRGLHHERRRGF